MKRKQFNVSLDEQLIRDIKAISSIYEIPIYEMIETAVKEKYKPTIDKIRQLKTNK